MKWKISKPTDSRKRILQLGALRRLGSLSDLFRRAPTPKGTESLEAAETRARLKELEIQLEAKEKESKLSKAELESAKDEIQQLCMKLARAIYNNSKVL